MTVRTSLESPRKARDCRCQVPIAYQDPGEWAMCAKCGHPLAADTVLLLGGRLVIEELVEGADDDLEMASPRPNGPEPRRRPPSAGRPTSPRGSLTPGAPSAASNGSGPAGFHWPFGDRRGEASA